MGFSLGSFRNHNLLILNNYQQILTRFWGYSEFRPLQLDIIESIGRGEDTLALMPTGGGKSLTFQILALSVEGICIVITPLIALMKDQVESLTRRKIKAIAIHSGLTREEIRIALDNCIYGDFKFLYLSPERIRTELFRIRVQEMNVNLIVVDEAHCISQWGYDFRPSYLDIHNLRELMKEVPVLALTATATPEVCDDIQERLSFRRKNLLQISFKRENLAYVVRQTEDKMRELLSIVKKLDGSGIVYIRNRKKCREVAEMLGEHGIKSGFYHAGLKHDDRDEKQQAWSRNSFRIMVATNAFGMGIDKPDVRFVIHLDLPDSPEAYFQEAGRAGRDGSKSYAILLYSPADKRIAAQRMAVNFPGIPRVREIYIALCNYLQIPLGSGKGRQFDFEPGDFLTRYRLNSMVVHSALKILAREGYITVTEEINNPSRLIFTVGRDDLYRFQVKHAKFDGFIKLLLRSYSGLFTQYVMVDESLMARRSGLTKKEVYNYLKNLASQQLIHYIPRKNVPVITFLEERLDEKNLFISPERYLFRKEQFEKRLSEMLRYASSETSCRSRFLLSYFGQMEAPRCGLCDVCLERNELDLSNYEFDLIVREIEEILTRNRCSMDALLEATNIDADKMIRVTEWLMDQGKIDRDKDLNFRWRSK